MLKLLSFFMLLVVLFVLFYGFSGSEKKKFSEVIDIGASETLDALSITETEDTNYNFTGFAHFFYIYVADIFSNTTPTQIIKRLNGSGTKEFKITIDQFNVLHVAFESQTIEYMLPLSKWTNICVNINSHAIELYVNGSLLKSNINAAKTGSDDLYDTNITIGDSGVATRKGWIAKYEYFDSPLDSFTINKKYQSDVNAYKNTLDEYGLRMTIDKNQQQLASIQF